MYAVTKALGKVNGRIGKTYGIEDNYVKTSDGILLNLGETGRELYKAYLEGIDTKDGFHGEF